MQKFIIINPSSYYYADVKLLLLSAWDTYYKEIYYTATFVAVLIPFVLLLLYSYLKYSHRYWERRNIPTLKPNIIFGNVTNSMSITSFSEWFDGLYHKSANEKYFGFFSFHKPFLMINDLEIIKNILTRDFSYFEDRGLELYSEREPLSHHLFNLEHARWKLLRKSFTSAFTPGKLKSAFGFVKECNDELTKLLHKMKNEDIEIKDVIDRYTMDIISSFGFGIATNSLANPDAKFRKMGDTIFQPRLEIYLRVMLRDFAPWLVDLLGLRFFQKKVTAFFTNTVDEVSTYRESNGVVRGDFLDLLISMKHDPTVEVDMSLDMMTAQCFLFFAAGYETSSSTISYCLLELARNPDIQLKVQEEIDEVLEKNNGELTFEVIQQLNYLDMVVSETLRMYPPLYILSRKCSRDYTIPGTKSTIDKNTQIFVPVYSIQHDPRYFENPHVFNPENFSAERKSSRHPFSYLPFGEGPKICIGKKFGLIEVKLAVASILQKYNLRLSNKMKLPIEYAWVTFTLKSKHGIWLKFSERNVKEQFQN